MEANKAYFMLLPAMDALTRRWLQRSYSPYIAELEAIAATLHFPGIWFLNGTYQWGCSTVAREEDGVPWLARTLDWPFPGLGRHVEIARMTETLSKTIASSDVVGFAQLTGDRNPIHLSEHFAAKTQFGKRIAHAPRGCPRASLLPLGRRRRPHLPDDCDAQFRSRQRRHHFLQRHLGPDHRVLIFVAARPPGCAGHR